MGFWKKNRGWIGLCLFLCGSYNLYFLLLLKETNRMYLWYLDVLLSVCGASYVGAAFCRHRKEQKKKQGLLQLDSVVCQEFSDMEHYDVARHDVAVLEGKLSEQFQVNCDLQDYVARWCHEMKLPLSAALLMIEKIEDSQLRFSLREQLERIRQQQRSVLLGCKVQGSLLDIQIRAVDLRECVRSSIRNNQFFLMRDAFSMKVDVEPVLVYSDKSWLTYVLDQAIANAVKYAMGQPALHIWSERAGEAVRLFVEDHGEGIAESDIRRVFDKGFVGSSHHNGQYKSTGMGLYMAARIVEKLGHGISVESKKGEWTRVCIAFEKAFDAENARL